MEQVIQVWTINNRNGGSQKVFFFLPYTHEMKWKTTTHLCNQLWDHNSLPWELSPPGALSHLLLVFYAHDAGRGKRNWYPQDSAQEKAFFFSDQKSLFSSPPGGFCTLFSLLELSSQILPWLFVRQASLSLLPRPHFLLDFLQSPFASWNYLLSVSILPYKLQLEWNALFKVVFPTPWTKQELNKYWLSTWMAE